MNNNNYRFNIAKTCEICKKSFITDIFQEKEMCSNCESIYQVLETCEDDEEFIDNDISDVINSIVNQGNCRAVAVRYDSQS